MALLRRTRPSGLIPYADLVEARSIDPMAGVVARDSALLVQVGIPMPPTWVVLADAFRHTTRSELPAGHDIASLLRVVDVPKGWERAARARGRLLDIELGTELGRELDRLWQETAPGPLLITTSPTCEDTETARAADLRLTPPLVRSREELDRAVRACWASAFSVGTLQYMRAHRVREYSIALLIQLVPGVSASGLIVTEPVEESDRGPRYLIGIAPPSALFRVGDSASTAYLHFDKAVADSPHPRWSTPTLTEFAAIATRLESAVPAEVELAIERTGTVLGLGAKPIQQHGYPRGGSAHTRWVRSLNEGPNVLTPMSRGLALSLARERVRQAGRRASAVTSVSGTIYFNLTPLLEDDDAEPAPAAEVLERVGGQLSIADAARPLPELSLPRAALSVARLGAEQKRLGDECDRLDAIAEQQRAWLAELDLAILPDDSLRTTLREGHAFYAKAARLMVLCDGVLVRAHRSLSALLSRGSPEHPDQLARAITAGVANLATATPAVALGHVLAIAAREPAARAGLGTGALPEGCATARALRQWLDAFGDLSLNDAELTVPRFREDPRFITRILQWGLQSAPPDAEAILSSVRANADRALAALEHRGSFLESRLLRDLVVRVRELVRLHGRARVRLGHALGMMRTIVLDVDRRLQRLDPQLREGDSFFSSLEELDATMGSGRADLRPLLELRRAEHEIQSARGLRPTHFVGAPKLTDAIPRDLEHLRGLGASSGTAEGTARVVSPLTESGPLQVKPGDILVLPWLDPGAAPLLLLAGGVVTELGNPWSPGAIVAREFGVPMVVGVPGALALLRDAARVVIDGDAGTVDVALDPGQARTA